MMNRQHYQPQIHEQIQRLFSEYEAPFYARMRGFGRTQTLALAESTVLGLAAGTDRSLNDTETRALTEHFLSSVHNMLAWKWIMTGLAGYMTYRGRQTMRFPFFKPTLTGGRFNPAIQLALQHTTAHSGLSESPSSRVSTFCARVIPWRGTRDSLHSCETGRSRPARSSGPSRTQAASNTEMLGSPNHNKNTRHSLMTSIRNILSPHNRKHNLKHNQNKHGRLTVAPNQHSSPLVTGT
jgi:hypothetical protein